jgi:crossover junction endodeoxyribonuclease RuvC
MIVVGIDPGSRHLGWGVLRVEGTLLAHVAHGVIDADERAPLADRLVTIDDALRAVLAAHRPNEAAIEALFFAKDAQAAAKLGHARGVALLALRRAGCSIDEYPPAVVKRAVAAHGRADKTQVGQMVAAMLALRELPRADASDALAVAIAHVRAAPARAIAKLTAARLASAGATTRTKPR